jgi:hypothetical protein
MNKTVVTAVTVPEIKTMSVLSTQSLELLLIEATFKKNNNATHHRIFLQ